MAPRAARQSTLPLASLAVLLIASCIPVQGIEPRERASAFIGYAEDHTGGVVAACRDRRENCEPEASSNQCLLNPYVMRRVCPISCNVEPCAEMGSVAQVRALDARVAARLLLLRARGALCCACGAAAAASRGHRHMRGTAPGLKQRATPG